MKKFFILGLAGLLLLAACGQTGPLYLPEDGESAGRETRDTTG